MTPDEARHLIGLERGFSPVELESEFRRRSHEMDSKIERAPTPGLKEKYRRTLTQLEEAWELLSEAQEIEVTPNFPTLQPGAEKHLPVTTKAENEIESKPGAKSTRSEASRGNFTGKEVLIGLGICGIVLIAGGLGIYYSVMPQDADSTIRTLPTVAEQQFSEWANSRNENVAAAQSATQIVPEKSASRETRTYTIEAGDSLWKIARKLYPDDPKNGVDKILEANKDILGSGQPVKVGRVLVLPPTSS